MQDSASRERVSTKALIEENSYSRLWHPASLYLLHPCSRIVEINNVGDDPLSPCPKGAKLEKQFSVAVLDKVPTWMWDIRIMQEQLSRITITFVLRLALIS
jgi:hypothetical protein